MISAWTAGLWAASIRGGLALLLAWGFSLLPRVPAFVRCWAWRGAYVVLLVSFAWTRPIPLPLRSAPEPRFVQRATPTIIRIEPDEISTYPVQPAAATAVAQPTVPRESIWPEVAFGAWCGFVVLFTSRLILSWTRARRLREGRSVELAELDELCRTLGVRRPPQLRTHPAASGPMLIGVLRPVIVLPESLAGSAELPILVAHELAHHRRRDLLWNWLPTIAAALIPLHPLVWLCNRRWRLAAESACDADALTATRADVSAYGRMIVNVAVSPFPVAGVLAVAAAGESRWLLKQRLVAMANVSRWKWPQTVTAGAVVVVGAVCGALPWKVVAQAVPSTQPQSSGPVTYGNAIDPRTTPGVEPPSNFVATSPAHLLPTYETVAPEPGTGRLSISEATLKAIRSVNGAQSATINLGSNAGLALGTYVVLFDRPLGDPRFARVICGLTVTAIEPGQATGWLEGPHLDELHVGMKTMVEFSLSTATDVTPLTTPSAHGATASVVPVPTPTTVPATNSSIITQGIVRASTIVIRSLMSATPEQVAVVDGQRVHKGDLLVQFQSRGQQAVDSAEQILKDSDDRYKLESLMESRGVATVLDVSQAKLDLDHARDTLQQRQFELTQSRIVAPFEGIVLGLRVAPGQTMLEGDPLMVLVRTELVTVNVPNPRPNTSQIVPGMTLTFEQDNPDGLPATSGVGRVLRVDPLSGEIELTVALTSSAGDLTKLKEPTQGRQLSKIVLSAPN